LTPRAIIAAVRAAGAQLEPDGESIRIRPAGVVSPELRAALANAKPRVLEILRGSAPRQESCGECGSRAWAISLVDEEGGRTCIDCLSGRTALRRSGAAVPPASGAGNPDGGAR
jgi:hypothetical protein